MCSVCERQQCTRTGDYTMCGRSQGVRVNTSERNDTVPLIILSERHPPSPNALCHPGLVGVVRRVRGRHRVAPELSGHRWPVGARPCAVGVEPGQNGMGSPGRRPFIPGTLSPPCPTSHSPAMARMDRESFNPTKTKLSKWHAFFIGGAG